MRKQTDRFEGLRVYVVVAGTVQTPIKITYSPKDGGIYSAGRFTNTRDIVQPAGRQAAQAAHARSMVEHELVMQDVMKAVRGGMKSRELRFAVKHHRVTCIVLQARDSFELIHVKALLDKAGVKTFEFSDEQEDLYEDVVTALATEPVTPFAVAGILDYLPLWAVK